MTEIKTVDEYGSDLLLQIDKFIQDSVPELGPPTPLIVDTNEKGGPNFNFMVTPEGHSPDSSREMEAGLRELLKNSSSNEFVFVAESFTLKRNAPRHIIDMLMSGDVRLSELPKTFSDSAVIVSHAYRDQRRGCIVEYILDSKDPDFKTITPPPRIAVLGDGSSAQVQGWFYTNVWKGI